MKMVAWSIGLLVVLPAVLVLLFTPADFEAWMWCSILWISGVPSLLPLVEYMRRSWKADDKERD